jgi:hypothetical protein
MMGIRRRLDLGCGPDVEPDQGLLLFHRGHSNIPSMIASVTTAPSSQSEISRRMAQ